MIPSGWATIVTMVVALVAAILQMFGHFVPQSDQGAIATAILAILGIILRFRTNTTVFKDTSPAPMPDVSASTLKGPTA